VAGVACFLLSCIVHIPSSLIKYVFRTKFRDKSLGPPKKYRFVQASEK
jgi:hypothetical protein